jgi:hypothetical protein
MSLYSQWMIQWILSLLRCPVIESQAYIRKTLVLSWIKSLRSVLCWTDHIEHWSLSRWTWQIIIVSATKSQALNLSFLSHWHFNSYSDLYTLFGLLSKHNVFKNVSKERPNVSHIKNFSCGNEIMYKLPNTYIFTYSIFANNSEKRVYQWKIGFESSGYIKNMITIFFLLLLFSLYSIN